MKVILVGAGEVGAYLAETLSGIAHDVTVLERDERVAESLDEHLDVRVLRESGSSARALKRAGIERCDFFLALTSNDESNLVSASLARALGARTTFARVHDETFRETSHLDYQAHFGIDHLLNPERLAAVEIAKHIRNPDRVAVEDFARGQIEVQLVDVKSGSAVAGKTLSELRLNPKMRVALVGRGEDSIAAKADLRLLPGDVATICGPPEVLYEVRPLFDQRTTPERDKRVVIMGGSEMGVSMVRLLGNRRFHIRVIERDARRCRFLADNFPHITVIHGEATSLRLLEEEQVGEADFFVACTRDDEDNVMTCLQARKLGVKRISLAINRADYNEIVQTSKATLGVDVAVSPRIATSHEVLRYLSTEKFVELARLPGRAGRLLELKVDAGSPCDGRALRDIRWPTGSVVLAVQQRSSIRTPGPGDVFAAGDRLVAIVPTELHTEVIGLVS
ncbi:Trk system potassium transporter TrkA [Opitutales bacterium ASA1]|uniref:Trk system potassium transporter TrkA n=1 Tax=Congregicoccus parvus TaxID=3081749 RepID=UPI002B2E2855|nr:Trk system potassium transporter TrkA [Opitutales bacterium ASA1]